MSERTYQQKLVWDRVHENLTEIAKLNEKMLTRASLIATSSSAIVALIAGAKFLPAHETPSLWETIALTALVACSVPLYWCFGQAIRPRVLFIPGSNDVPQLEQCYLTQDEDVAYRQALLDACAALQQAIRDNACRGRAVIWMVWTFQLQLGLLAIAILVKTLPT